MAVYIKQSPPREGVRGGWEDFNWESLKSQSNAERDYYLGASAKVGICTRGKFEKFDWWTKKKEPAGQTDAAEDELQRVKRFEQQLLEEALGRRPRHLLAGEALEEEAPRPTAAPEAGPAAEKALKKLKKEQKKLKKLKRKEQKREARLLRLLKKERRSDSRSSREPSPPVRNSSSVDRRQHERSGKHTRQHYGRSRSPYTDRSLYRSCGVDASRVAVKLRRSPFEARGGSDTRLPGGESRQREARKEQLEEGSRKRGRSYSAERGSRKTRHRSRPVDSERKARESYYRSGYFQLESSRRHVRDSRDAERDHRRRDSRDHRGTHRTEQKTQEIENCRLRSRRSGVVIEGAEQLRGSIERASRDEREACRAPGEGRGIKKELVEEDRKRNMGSTQPRDNDTAAKARSDAEVPRVKREL
ncbi:trichohyalin [Cyclospora cayetanensis]|uniref:Uncharacterized protein n=2 Tax=Cyclospora cayetanensis TaxID=88456 RepID=A0A1D3D011_9EIME|nr:trichohyalin [Cyclospora cayetanensis]OEH76739.1 hypothetical protein cyc_07507 [Cyclospora cayetanensis]